MLLAVKQAALSKVRAVCMMPCCTHRGTAQTPSIRGLKGAATVSTVWLQQHTFKLVIISSQVDNEQACIDHRVKAAYLRLE